MDEDLVRVLSDVLSEVDEHRVESEEGDRGRVKSDSG